MSHSNTQEQELGKMITESCIREGGPVLFEACINPLGNGKVHLSMNIVGTWQRVETMCLKAHGMLCFVCGKTAIQRCGTCLNTGYCSNTCQKADWTKHMEVCFKNTQGLLFQQWKKPTKKFEPRQSIRVPPGVAEFVE